MHTCALSLECSSQNSMNLFSLMHVLYRPVYCSPIIEVLPRQRSSVGTREANRKSQFQIKELPIAHVGGDITPQTFQDVYKFKKMVFLIMILI